MSSGSARFPIIPGQGVVRGRIMVCIGIAPWFGEWTADYCEHVADGDIEYDEAFVAFMLSLAVQVQP